jgi:enoyl-CoA hydratase/carnithine racemase
MPKTYTDIELTEERGIATLKLNRPDVRNALRPKTFEEIQHAMLNLSARVLILTGADPSFCSGEDVKEGLGGGEQRERPSIPPRLTPAADVFLYTDIPVIAAVNGPAVGWGMEMTLMADFRIASERSRFGELFVLRGLICDSASLGRLAQLVGREYATEMLLTGQVIDAEEAKRAGLVGRLVAHDDLMPTAWSLAERIAANPPLAVQGIKNGLRRALDPDWASLGRWAGEMFAMLGQTEDFREGVRSFLEKREPKFVGR